MPTQTHEELGDLRFSFQFYGLGTQGKGVQFPVGAKCPKRLWGPPCLQFNWCWRRFPQVQGGRCVKLVCSLFGELSIFSLKQKRDRRNEMQNFRQNTGLTQCLVYEFYFASKNMLTRCEQRIVEAL
jgi:hypothetical protein